MSARSLHIQDLSILVVEPSEAQSRIIAYELEKSGAQKIECAKTIDAAMMCLETYAPDLVISAMYFKDGTGTSLLQSIRADERLAETPFMLVSSENRFKYLDPIKQAGVVAILPKPFASADLERALLATLDFLEDDELELDNFDVATVRILLVDDSKLARIHIRRILEKMGAETITEAEDGAKAIDMLKETEFDLVITDYNMPNVDGEQLLQYIRNESGQSYVPVLMVTSERNEATLSSIQQSGVSALCDKPFDTQHVKQIFRNLL